MVLNFQEFNDLINIHNKTFSQSLTEFQPMSLIYSVVTETKKVYDFTPCLQLKKLPKIILGDKYRLKYILACLVLNSIKRND